MVKVVLLIVNCPRKYEVNDYILNSLCWVISQCMCVHLDLLADDMHIIIINVALLPLTLANVFAHARVTCELYWRTFIIYLLNMNLEGKFWKLVERTKCILVILTVDE